MAAVLTSSVARISKAQERFSSLIRRRVAPRLAELEAFRERQRQRFLAILLADAAGIVVVLPLLWRLDLGYAVLAAFGLGALGLFLLQHTQRVFVRRVRETVMPAVCEAIGDLRSMTGMAPGLDFEGLESFGLLPRHNRKAVDDVFVGRHRDTDFTMAEVRLSYRSAGRRRSTRTKFRGLILAIATPREVGARILIARDTGLFGNRLKGWFKTFSGLQRLALPHPAFEARFEVFSDHPGRALETITPSFCDSLAALADAHQGAPLQGAFLGERFYLAMPRRGDQFAIGSLFRPLDRLEDDAARLLHDVQIVHRVIDCLHGERPQDL
ncbi:MAG: DUF3137 domain-containing protein [Geminicoccaceae bacterium]